MQDTEATPIQILGRGVVKRSSAHYEPGEYKEFTNVLVTPEETIKKRPPAVGLRHKFDTYLHKFIGSWGGDAVYSGYSNSAPHMYRTLNDSSIILIPEEGTSIATTVIAASAMTGEWVNHVVSYEGILQYNKKNYILVCHSASHTTTGVAYYQSRYYVIQAKFNYTAPHELFPLTVETTTDAVPPVAITYAPFGSGTVSGPAASGSFNVTPFEVFTGFFMHKDRCFVAAADTVYFSKVADPTKFAVADDGGFFKFPGKTITKIVSLGDSIYVIFDNSVAVITYNQGPNIDPSVKIISEGFGGQDAILYGGTIYVVDFSALYSITGFNITKVLDLELDLYPTQMSAPATSPIDLGAGFYATLCMVAYADSLYITKRRIVFAATQPGSVEATWDQETETWDTRTPQSAIWNDLSTTSIFHSKYLASPFPDEGIFRLDINNGHMSEYKYGYGDKPLFKVSDFQVVNYEGPFDNQPTLYMLSCQNDGTRSFFHATNARFMYESGSTVKVFADLPHYSLDSYGTDDGLDLVVAPINVMIRVIGLSPDTMKYMNKKFRSLEIQADYPSICLGNPAVDPFVGELELVVQGGSEFVEASRAILKEVLQNKKPTNGTKGFRYGVNQRASSVNVILKTRDIVIPHFKKWDTYFSDQPSRDQVSGSLLEIVDLRMLWTPSRRGPTNYSRDRS